MPTPRPDPVLRQLLLVPGMAHASVHQRKHFAVHPHLLQTSAGRPPPPGNRMNSSSLPWESFPISNQIGGTAAPSVHCVIRLLRVKGTSAILGYVLAPLSFPQAGLRRATQAHPRSGPDAKNRPPARNWLRGCVVAKVPPARSIISPLAIQHRGITFSAGLRPGCNPAPAPGYQAVFRLHPDRHSHPVLVTSRVCPSKYKYSTPASRRRQFGITLAAQHTRAPSASASHHRRQTLRTAATAM